MKKLLSLALIHCLISMPTAFAAGKLQNEDFKTEAQLISAGSDKSHLLNDTKAYVTANGINDTLYNAITNGQIGGTPSGSVNLTNGGFENNLTGWATYKNTAGVLPVTGTGGSPTSTLTVGCASGCTTTTTALYGTKSGVMNHPASNVQGEGASYDFNIDPGLTNSVVTLTGSYSPVSGTYYGGDGTAATHSDVEIYIIDKTTGEVKQPTGWKLDGTVIGQKYQMSATFQTNSGTSYRMAFHYPNTTATAFSLAYDIAGISQSKGGQGTIETPWTAYTPTFTGLGTVTNIAFFWKRIGENLYIKGKATTGTPTATTMDITFPLNLKVNGNLITSLSYAGTYLRNVTSSVHGGALLVNANDPSFGLSDSGTFGSSNVSSLSKASGTASFGGGEDFSLTLGPIPVTGWGSNQTLSSDSGGRVVAGSYQASSQSLTANSTNISFGTINFDTHGAYSGGIYTAPEPGYYEISGANCTATTATGFSFVAYKNGSSNIFLGQNNSNGGDSATLAGVIQLNAGDQFSIRSNISVTLASGCQFQIHKIVNPSQIQSAETIAASYWVSASFAASTTTPINFDSKEYDTHNAVTTSSTAWRFTAPAPGLYSIQGYVYAGSTSVNIAVYKNGTIYKYVSYVANLNNEISSSIKLLAGEYIDIRPGASATMNGGALSAANTCQISITRTGNY